LINIRRLEENEFDFFKEMMYESIHIPENKPPRDELLNLPHLKKYSEEWGREGDRVLIALKERKPIGAAWYRLFDESNKGYGFVDNQTPELGIAILPEARRIGAGKQLMNSLIDQARIDGYKALSLSVDPTNKIAAELYQKLGFKRCGISGTSWTMIYNIS
jgi:ribosomal protein S18 acetylase RimI-like enzyme